MRIIGGRCHCGNVSFELDWPESDGSIAVRACGCGFCTKHGGVYTSHPRARLRARVANGGDVSLYEFGTGTAEFFVCSVCGVVPFVTSVIDGRRYAVVNVNTFENMDPAALDSSPTDFDGETLDDRLGRRKRNWIPDVEVQGME